MIKHLLKCVREYKKASILTPVFVAIEVVLECFIPFITANLIDYFNGNPATGYHNFKIMGALIASPGEMNIWHILIYGGILVAMASLALVFGMLSGKFCATASAGFAKNLRRDIYYNIQEFSFHNMDKYSTPSLITRLTTDVTNIQNAYMMIIRTAVRAPLMLIFSLVMSFTVNWALALIFVAAIPVLVLVLVFIMMKVMPIFRKVFKKYDKMNMRVQEDLHGIRVVKSYVREDYEIEKFNKSSEEIRKDFVSAERMMAGVSPIMNFVMYALIILICGLGSLIIVNSGGGQTITGWYGGLSTGGLSSMLSYSTMSLMSLMMLAMVLVMVSMSIESARRVTEVLGEKSTLISPENGLTDVADGSVEFENVSFSYSGGADKPALSGASLKIKSGETVGILGSTGSAKTTLVQLIPRLYDATEGVVRVGGRDVKEYDLESLRKNVAMVLQKNVLFSGTIKENLRWGNPAATDEQLIDACRLAQAHDFISQFPLGYDTKIEQSGKNVSGGQRQRLCIARALLTQPKIIIFDDSTSAVDTKTDALIREAMAKHISDTTKIIIAQRVDSVRGADKIIVMDNGRIDAVGDHNSLLADNKIYREVYYTQNKEAEEK